MACGSCGGRGGAPKFGSINMGSLRGRTMPNPMAMRAAMASQPQAAPQFQQQQQNFAMQQGTPFTANMSIERRAIEQRRRLAALRALGK